MANERDSVLCASQQVEPAKGRFDKFFREQYSALVRFLRRRSRTDEDAEDDAQESLTRLIRYIKSQPPAAWKPALYRIAVNVSKDRLRKLQSHGADQHLQVEEIEVESDQPGMEESAARAQQRAMLREAILALPPKCRHAYLLKLQGMTNVEVAKRCGVSVRMIEKHLANALLHIGRRFG
jgi:RNA polymerase sigma factor (sigma-70 family)